MMASFKSLSDNFNDLTDTTERWLALLPLGAEESHWLSIRPPLTTAEEKGKTVLLLPGRGRTLGCSHALHSQVCIREASLSTIRDESPSSTQLSLTPLQLGEVGVRTPIKYLCRWLLPQSLLAWVAMRPYIFFL